MFVIKIYHSNARYFYFCYFYFYFYFFKIDIIIMESLSRRHQHISTQDIPRRVWRGITMQFAVVENIHLTICQPYYSPHSFFHPSKKRGHQQWSNEWVGYKDLNRANLLSLLLIYYFEVPCRGKKALWNKDLNTSIKLIFFFMIDFLVWKEREMRWVQESFIPSSIDSFLHFNSIFLPNSLVAHTI